MTTSAARSSCLHTPSQRLADTSLVLWSRCVDAHPSQGGTARQTSAFDADSARLHATGTSQTAPAPRPEPRGGHLVGPGVSEGSHPSQCRQGQWGWTAGGTSPAGQGAGAPCDRVMGSACDPAQGPIDSKSSLDEASNLTGRKRWGLAVPCREGQGEQQPGSGRCKLFSGVLLISSC